VAGRHRERGAEMEGGGDREGGRESDRERERGTQVMGWMMGGEEPEGL
jgi:hypothetical protein